MDETRRDIGDTQDFGTRQDFETQDGVETLLGLGTQHGVETRFEGKSASTDDITMRFGPGVPPSLANAWREGRPRRRPLWRRIVAGLLTLGLAVVTGLIVYWLLRAGPSVEVTGVTMSAPAGVQQCDTTAEIVGVIHTNGGQGDVSYRWKRSDGQNSGVFTDTMPRGRKSIRVPLRWTVQGPGALHAVATLEVITPKTSDGTAAASFDYSCH